MDSLLNVLDLSVEFELYNKTIHAVNNISFEVKRKEVLAIVGESGCGKSATANAIMRLIFPPGKIKKGKIIFDGANILSLSGKEMQKIRGKDISMIFQEPLSALNPVFRVGWQVDEVLKTHFPDMSDDEIKSRTIDMFKELSIPMPNRTYMSYPHELSGGMRQRVIIAMAMITNPKLIIADEPTTALDVSVQAQIIKLLKDIRARHNTTIMIITHNLGVVAQIADRVMVMYAGEVMEVSPLYELFKTPLHPYTLGLLASTPSLSTSKELKPIPGTLPDPSIKIDYCPFAPRCKFARDICFGQKPEFKVFDSRLVKCFFPLA